MIENIHRVKIQRRLSGNVRELGLKIEKALFALHGMRRYWFRRVGIIPSKEAFSALHFFLVIFPQVLDSMALAALSKQFLFIVLALSQAPINLSDSAVSKAAFQVVQKIASVLVSSVPIITRILFPMFRTQIRT